MRVEIQKYFTLMIGFLSLYASGQDVLPAKQDRLHYSLEQFPESAHSPTQYENIVELYLPKNRCELGWLKWGNEKTGYNRCRALGRGETKFGSVERLQNLKQQSKHYKDWSIGELPVPIKRADIKESERYYIDGSEAEACLFKPDHWSNGKTIATRESGTLGHYLLYTKVGGRKYHRAKASWGKDSNGQLLPGVKMIEIKSEEDQQYAKGDLLDRYDFYIHSHWRYKEKAPLEALSTWGCPRLSLPCQEDFYAWVYSVNESGVSPRLIIKEDDELAYRD